MRNDALRVVSELAASQHNVFTRAQAAHAGVNRRQLTQLVRTGLVSEPFPATFVVTPTGEPTWKERARAATIASRPSALSDSAAARVLAFDGFLDHPSLEVCVEAPRLVRLPGLTAHRVKQLDRCDVTNVDGIRVTNIARTLCDLGNSYEPLMVERALDHAVRNHANRQWIRRTAERLQRPGVSGPVMLLGLLDELEKRGRVRDSWFEKLVELCLDDPELSGLTRQHPLRDPTGKVVARFDLAIAEVRLGIEGHSRTHHFGRRAEASDERRDNEAAKLGWDVMYIGYGDIESPATVREDVRARFRVRRRDVA